MKKIFSIFGALLAGAMMFSCSDQFEDEITFGTEISASVEALAEFAAEDAEAQTFDVEANGEWTIIAPSWLEIAPRSGAAGTTTVTVKPSNNYMMVEQENGEMVQELGYAREATIQIAGEQDMKVAVDANGDDEQDVDEDGELVWEYVSALAEVAVTQAGDPDKVYTGPEKITVAEFIKRADDKTPYELTGTITRVANTYYGNFDLTDETGTIYIYGLLDAEGEKCYEANGIKLGDTITVQGTYTLYNTTHEIVNATYISHEEGGPVEIMPSSIGDFLEAANPSQLYELTGVVKNITGAEYGNFDLVDATGSVYVYGLLTEEGGASKQFASLDIQEGDILTLVGNYATYNEQAQVGSAYHVSHIDVSAKTVAEFLATEEGDDYYMLTGTIANLKDGDQYGNIDLVDETGSVYVYGVHVGYNGSNGKFQQLVEAHGLKNGDTLTIIGKHGSYNGEDQVTKAFYYSHEAGEGGGEEPEPEPEPTVKTIAEVLEAEGALAEGTLVEGVVISNMDLNNLTSKKGMYIQDETAALQFYLAANHEFAFGDKVQIDLSGVTIGEYNGAVQVSGVALEKITKISSDNAVEAKVVTIADFLANKYEGQYVAIEGVQVAEADLANTWVMGGAHTSINIEDAEGNNFVVFSSKYATYGAETVAQGSGTIKGISSINKGAMQLIFAQASDYAELTGARFGGSTEPEPEPEPELGEWAGRDDFNTVAHNSSYLDRTTTAGWAATFCAVQSGGATDANPVLPSLLGSNPDTRAFCIAGGTDKIGTITSPVLNGGIGKLKFTYGLAFTDKNGVDMDVTIMQNGEAVKTINVKTACNKYEVQNFEQEINIAGDFQIVFTNNCPSQLTGNKDRISIWDVMWTGCTDGGTDGGETTGGTLAWGSADFAAIQAAVGDELNATTLAAVTATEDLTVNADGITYKGLELSLGGGKFKFGTNYGVASQEGDKPTRIQVGGAGKLSDMKQIISFKVPAAGTLKVDAVSSSKDETRPFAVAIDGNEIGQYTTVQQGQESTGEIFTIDCSAATAGSTIYLYSAKSGINFFTIEYTY